MTKINYNYKNLRMVATQNTINMYNTKYDNNGYICCNVNTRDIEFTVYSDNGLTSHSRFIVDYCESNDFTDNDTFFNIETDGYEVVHPFYDGWYKNNIHCFNKDNIELILIDLIKFARFNELDIFINNVSMDNYPNIKEFIFGHTYSVGVGELKEIIKKIGLRQFNKIARDCIPDYINIDNLADIIDFSNDNKNILLPKTVWNSINNHPFMDDIDKIYIGEDNHVPMLLWYREAITRAVYTLDGVYTHQYYLDIELDEYLSFDVDYERLYNDSDGNSCDYISRFVIELNDGAIYDNDYVYVDGEDGYYHQDCVWYDDCRDEYRLDNDVDDKYIHSYKSSDRDLRMPQKFIKGTKFQCGLEVEVEFGYDREDTAEYLVENHSSNERNFILEEDGSLSDGFEMVTSPFIFDGQLPEWLSKSLDYIENDTDREFYHCGGHIHIDRNSFVNRESIQLFTYLFNEYDVYIAKLSGRDDISPDYAQSQKGTFDTVLDVHTTDNNWYSRYVYINRQNSATVEVRIFKGCTDKNIIVKRLNLLQQMVNYCNNFVENNADVLDNKSIIDGISWYDFSGLDSQATREFNGEYYN